jgi:hypothetical protein
LCFLNLLKCLHHWLLQAFLFLLVSNTLVFFWLSILEHMFFSYFISCGTLTSTTFTFVVIVYVSAIGWTFATTTNFPWNIFYILTNFGQSVILCPFKQQMWHAYENVFCGFWLGCAASVVATMIYFFFFLLVCTLWFIIPQFVQCLLVFLILFCVFAHVACLVLCGIESAFLAFVLIMPFPHNIATSLCCYNDYHFILVVIIMKYNCKPILNIIVKKLFVVGTCKPWASFWIRS